MEKLSISLDRFKPKEASKSKITNQRQEVIKMFLDELNPEREKGGYKPLSPGFVGLRLRYMDTGQLRQFYGTCKESKSFAKYWWWATNPKNYVA